MTTGGRTNTEQFCVCFFSLSFCVFLKVCLPEFLVGGAQKHEAHWTLRFKFPLVKSHAAGWAALLAWQSDLGPLKLTSYVNRQYQFCGTVQQKGSSLLCCDRTGACYLRRTFCNSSLCLCLQCLAHFPSDLAVFTQVLVSKNRRNRAAKCSRGS